MGQLLKEVIKTPASLWLPSLPHVLCLWHFSSWSKRGGCDLSKQHICVLHKEKSKAKGGLPLGVPYSLLLNQERPTHETSAIPQQSEPCHIFRDPGR